MASILETFYILFKSNAKEVKKDYEEVNKESDKTTQHLQKTSKAVEEVGGRFADLGRSLVATAAAFVSVSSVIGHLKESFNYALDLDRTSKAMNVNIETLDAWGRAVQKNGGSAEGFQSSIKGLAKTLNIRNQDALKLLPMLADTFKKVGTDKAMRFGQSIGLDQATIMLLQQGRREVEAVIARQKELGVVTKHDAEISEEFNSKWSDMTYAFRIMWLRVADVVLPIFAKLAEGLTKVAEYMQKHANAIIGALIGIGVAAAIFAAPFVIANAAIIGMTIAIGAAIAAFAILYEDVEAFMHGQSSLIGDILKKWPIVGTVAKTVFQGIKEAIEIVLAPLKLLLTGLEKAASIAPSIAKGAEKLKSWFGGGGSNELNSPLMAATSNSLFNSSTIGGDRSVAVNTGPITINTQATDGDQVSGALARGLRDQLRQATGTFDDGQLI